MTSNLAQEPWEKAGMVITCFHVLRKRERAEYMEEDDGYICTPCRDNLEENGFGAVKHLLCYVHRGCLEDAVL